MDAREDKGDRMNADYEIRRLEQKLSNLEFDKDAELAALRARIAELEADALARLIEEPTNERIMKDVYDENERLQKAVEEAEGLMRFSGAPVFVTWLKEYGGKE